MDAFYAAIETLRHPWLANQPLLVGGTPRNRGVVCTCNYLARSFGIRSAMPTHRALELCPQAQLIYPDLPHYRQVSKKLHAILAEYSSVIEPLSLDEAYLLLPDDGKLAVEVARELQQRVYKVLNLSCSLGVSYNKFIAKIASGYRKPNGLTVVPPEKALKFLHRLPIEKFYSIGPKLSRKFHLLGIGNGADLYRQSLAMLCGQFGRQGYFIYQAVRGIDQRPVARPGIAKSISRETTFPNDLTSLKPLRSHLQQLLDEVLAELILQKMSSRCLTVKVRYHDFSSCSRSQRLQHHSNDKRLITALTLRLLTTLFDPAKRIRLLGVNCSLLQPANRYPDLPWPTGELNRHWGDNG